MRERWFAAVAAALLTVPSAEAGELAPLAGKWRGAWHRGMTSGRMILEVAADGRATVALTHLETFGQSPAALAEARAGDATFEFSARGASGSEFSARAELAAAGKVLRGSARYEGLPLKFELHRQE